MAVEDLVAQMTLNEKVRMLSGETAWIIPGCARLGVSSWTVSDGPIGVRGRGQAPALCLPSPSAWAATWDVDLVAELGAAAAREAKDRAVQVVLGPTVNIHRDPRAGRHFECYSEDPHLSARIAVAYVRALQDNGVGACVKHFVANDQETERHSISAEVGERALREVYLVPFEAAVREAGAWSVMAAYNDVNGVQACEHRDLLENVLRGEWGFRGLVISDWWAVKDTVRPALAGLDIEMPGPGRFWGGERLSDAVRSGGVPEATIDEKVRRVLAFLGWAGGVGATLPDTEASIDRPEHRTLARRAAARSMVLLKNDGNVLPLAAGSLQRVAVFGPNARETVLLGGGSAAVTPHHTTNVLDALRERLPGQAEVVYEPGPSLVRRVRDFSSDVLGPEGVTVEVFDGPEPTGDPAIRTSVNRPFFAWTAETWPVAGPDVSARATGAFTPDSGGRWRLGIAGLGEARLLLDGEVVADTADGWVNSGMEQHLAVGWRELQAGRPYEVVAEYRAARHHMRMAGFRFGGVPDPEDQDFLARAAETARDADVAIVVTGTNVEAESEGSDRLMISLPGEQDALVAAVAAANPRTIVVNNSGSPVTMPWVGAVPAILQAWYPGQEGGEAAVDVLLGEAEPGGRMPTTWPQRLEDVPAFTSFPGEAGHVEYTEGVFVGHRWYDARKIEPLWAFGHGLSYTAFAWGEPRVSASAIRDDAEFTLTVEVPITNTGARAGSEVVQCYVSPIKPRLLRPLQELKAFARVDLAPGETKAARLTLDRRAFCAWDPRTRRWTVDGRAFDLRLGASSRDIRATSRLEVERR